MTKEHCLQDIFVNNVRNSFFSLFKAALQILDNPDLSLEKWVKNIATVFHQKLRKTKL